MKSKIIDISVILILLLSVLSCRQQVVSSRSTVPFVSDILSDKYAPENLMLRHHQEPVPSGDIVIIGADSLCMRFAEFFTSAETRDNVSGSHLQDDLPDFAGETLSCVIDDADYSSMFNSLGEEAFREQVVRRTLAAVDTVLHISPYDIDGLGYKNPAKIIILADPFFAEYGAFDVATLFASSGCGIPVIVPVDMVFSKAFAEAPDRNITVGLICGGAQSDTGIYRKRFSSVSSKCGKEGSELFAFVNDGRDSLVHHFLDAYAASGMTRPLDAVIFDDIHIDVDLLKAEFADMLSVHNESSMIYGRMISKDFEVIETKKLVAEYCYDVLRRDNLFTHNIALPAVEFYRVFPEPRSSDGSIILINSIYVQD